MISGANRGLGLEFVRQLSADQSNTIIAAVRSLQGDISDLKALQDKSASSSPSSKIHILECDTGNVESIHAFGNDLAKEMAENSRVDYLLNVAGINNVPDQTSLTLDGAELRKHIDINVLGPLETTKAVLPFLKPGSAVLNMTSGMGSCGKNVVKCTTYAISKCALNMATVHSAEDLKQKGIKVICMDPGWVKTRMGGEGAMIEPEESIGGMLKVLHGLKDEDTGKFFVYDGSVEQW